MDTAQIVLLVVLGVLTILLVVLGIQVFIILRGLGRTINRVNKVLGDAGLISESISKPVVSMSTVLSGVKLGSLIASFFEGKKKHIKEGQ